VLTRTKHHWSQLLSDDNPRGYNPKQKQRIADADTLTKKLGVELHVVQQRLVSEMRIKEPADDGYGVDRINAMIVDIEAEYDARIKDAAAGAADDDEENGDVSEGF
jgi:hypothetical protein